MGGGQYSDPIAFWFSVLYNNGSYIIFQSTLRGDIGEFIALILFPVVFFGFQMLYNSDTSLWFLLPIGLSLVAYSHLLSVFIFSSLLMLLFCIKYEQISLDVLKRLTISIIVFLVLIMPIIVPMIFITRSTKVLTPMSGIIQNEALNPVDLLVNSIKNRVPVSMQSTNIGMLIVFVIAIGIITLVLKPKSINYVNEIKTFFILGLIYIVLSTRLFPWFLLNNSPIKIIQFPWRFLGIATFCIAYAGALEFGQLCMSKRLIFAFVLCINVLNIRYVHAYLTLQPTRFYQYHNVNGFYKMATSAEYYDYMSAGKINNKGNDLLKRKLTMYQNYAMINGKRVKLRSDQIHPGYKKMTYNIDGLRSGKLNKIVLPLNNYGLNKSKQGRVKENSEGNTVIWIRSSKTYKNITINN